MKHESLSARVERVRDVDNGNGGSERESHLLIQMLAPAYQLSALDKLAPAHQLSALDLSRVIADQTSKCSIFFPSIYRPVRLTVVIRA